MNGAGELSVPALALALLLGVEPSDRALAGWTPLYDVGTVYGQFLQAHDCKPECLPPSL